MRSKQCRCRPLRLQFRHRTAVGQGQLAGPHARVAGVQRGAPRLMTRAGLPSRLLSQRARPVRQNMALGGGLFGTWSTAAAGVK